MLWISLEWKKRGVLDLNSQSFLDCLTSYMSDHLNASLCTGELSDPQVAVTVVLKFSFFLTAADLKHPHRFGSAVVWGGNNLASLHSEDTISFLGTPNPVSLYLLCHILLKCLSLPIISTPLHWCHVRRPLLISVSDGRRQIHALWSWPLQLLSLSGIIFSA